MNKSSVFDIEKKNGKYTVSKLPEMVYFDTSFIGEVIGYNSDKQSKTLCKEFISELSLNNSLLVISPIVLEELYHIIRAKYVCNLLGDQNLKSKDIESYIARHPDVHSAIMKEIRKVKIELEPIFISLSYNHDDKFDELTVRVMELFQLDSKDAQHIAYCLLNGINNIATIDYGFSRTDNMNIYTTNQRMISECSTRSNVYIKHNDSFLDYIK